MLITRYTLLRNSLTYASPKKYFISNARHWLVRNIFFRFSKFYELVEFIGKLRFTLIRTRCRSRIKFHDVFSKCAYPHIYYNSSNLKKFLYFEKFRMVGKYTAKKNKTLIISYVKLIWNIQLCVVKFKRIFRSKKFQRSFKLILKKKEKFDRVKIIEIGIKRLEKVSYKFDRFIRISPPIIITGVKIKREVLFIDEQRQQQRHQQRHQQWQQIWVSG